MPTISITKELPTKSWHHSTLTFKNGWLDDWSSFIIQNALRHIFSCSKNNGHIPPSNINKTINQGPSFNWSCINVEWMQILINLPNKTLNNVRQDRQKEIYTKWNFKQIILNFSFIKFPSLTTQHLRHS